MNFHIRFLKCVFALVLTAAPAGLGVNVSYFIRNAVKRKSLFTDYLGMIISYALILISVSFLGEFSPGNIILKTEIFWYVLSPVTALCALALEFAMGAAIISVQGRGKPYGIRVHSVYSEREKLNAADITAVGLFVITEEMVFRAALFEILHKIGLGIPVMIAAGAVIFALNHIHFGKAVALQKMLSGALFGMTYVFSGYCFVIPAAAHMVQNYMLLWISRAEGKRVRQ